MFVVFLFLRKLVKRFFGLMIYMRILARLLTILDRIHAVYNPAGIYLLKATMQTPGQCVKSVQS